MITSSPLALAMWNGSASETTGIQVIQLLVADASISMEPEAALMTLWFVSVWIACCVRVFGTSMLTYG